MDNLLRKLQFDKSFDNWTFEEEKQLLELYLVISKKESLIFDMIYRYHGCDSFEDIFRDYDETYLEDKATGVEIAIREITEQINRNKKK